MRKMIESYDVSVVSMDLVFISNITIGENLELIFAYNSKLSNREVKDRIYSDFASIGLEDVISKRAHQVTQEEQFWAKVIRATYMQKGILIYRPFDQAPHIHHMSEIIQNIEKLGHNGKIFLCENSSFKVRFDDHE
jgi:ABC-type lipoprotein export system ATPase subunit